MRRVLPMPLLDNRFWFRRRASLHPCHYQDRWLDTYADLVRKLALLRIFPRWDADSTVALSTDGKRRVLDVGCGDARLSAWIARSFGCRVWGVDAIDWPGASDRLAGLFTVLDAEKMSEDRGLRMFQPHVAVAVTSLPFMRDWRLAVGEMCRLAERVLVLDNLQTPAPAWQRGLGYKEPIEMPALVHEFARHDFRLERWAGVNLLDRALFRRLPAPLAFLITLPLDAALAFVVPARRCRYAAVLFRAEPS
jgi:SAM-dependent methyltransferase